MINQAEQPENSVLGAADADIDDLDDKDAGIAPVGLTDWKKPPRLEELKQDLQDAKSHHSSQETKISNWLDNLNVTGAAKIKPIAGNSSVQPRLIRKQAEWRYAALSEPYLSTDDVFKVKPISWEDRKAAQQNQLVLNNQFNTQIGKVHFIDTLIRTLVDEGTAVVYTSWVFKEEKYQAQVPRVQYEVDPEFAPQLQQLMQLKQESPSEYATNVPDHVKKAVDLSLQVQKPVRPVELGGMEEVTKTRTLRNSPEAEVMHYKNIVIDPTCEGDIKKARFAIRSFESSKAELQKEGKYKNLDAILTSNNGPLSQSDHDSTEGAANFQFRDEPRKRLVVFEYWGFWDVHGTGDLVPIVCAWVGNVMIRLEVNPYPDKQLPFVIFQYLPVRRNTHGEPDGVLIEDNQKIVGAVTRGMLDIMAKSANGQTGMRKDMLDAVNKRKWQKGEDYEYNGNIDPRVGVHMHTYPEIPQSAPMMLQMQNQEAEALTGVKSFSDGMSGNSLGDVAAGIRGALDAASKRELGILRRISAGIVEIGRKFISMNAEFLDPEEVVRITNEEHVMVRRDDLPGNFDLQLDISTAEGDEKKAQELAFMLQTLGPNTDPEMVRMILSDIARLRKMPELSKKIEKFEPKPDPLAVQKAQLEIALLQAQIATEQAKAAQLGASAVLHENKAGTEVAKQAHLNSDTDKKNLDFVEKETGVEQERKLEQIDRQAGHNLEHEVVKHHLEQKAAKNSASSK